MVAKGHLSNNRLRNHSARKQLMPQKLNDNDIPPSHIVPLSGHKNVQSVENHSSINTGQQGNMSEILSSTKSKTVHKRSTSHGASSPTAMPTTLKLFQGSNIMAALLTFP